MQKTILTLFMIATLAACGKTGESGESSAEPGDSTASTSLGHSDDGAGVFPMQFTDAGRKIQFRKYEKGPVADSFFAMNDDFEPYNEPDSSFKGDCYVLKKLDGNSFQLCDIPEEIASDAVRDYSLLGSYKGLPYWFFFVNIYEGSESEIVNQKTGHRTVALPEFALSPDKKHVLAYHSMDAFGWAGFEMYLAGDDSLELEWEIEMDNWGPEAVGWTAEGDLLVKAMMGNEGDDSQYVEYLILEEGLAD